MNPPPASSHRAAPSPATGVGAWSLDRWAHADDRLAEMAFSTRRRPGHVRDLTVAEVTATGIARQDIVAFAAPQVAPDDVVDQGDASLSEFSDALVHDLISTGKVFPDLTVRAGLAWALLGVFDEEGTGRMLGLNRLLFWLAGMPVDYPMDRAARDWVTTDVLDAGAVAERGWRYAAAGLTRTEADAREAAGTLDEDALLALVGLRGAPVPVTR